MNDWHQDWFNQDYMNLYAHRDNNEANKHVAFIKNVTGICNGKILDIGCGAGRHALIFARDGFDVTAVDTSEDLLNLAKQKDKENKVHWIHADYRDLELSQSFHLVLSIFTSFGYFENDSQNKKLFSIVSKSLKQNGMFFLDYLNPEFVEKTLVESEVINVKGVVVKVRRALEKGGVKKEIQFPHRTYIEYVKFYSRRQIEEMASACALQVQGFWGGYNTQDSDRQLFLFQKS